MKSHYNNYIYKLFGMENDGEGTLEALAYASIMVFLMLAMVGILALIFKTIFF